MKVTRKDEFVLIIIEIEDPGELFTLKELLDEGIEMFDKSTISYEITRDLIERLKHFSHQ